MTARREDREDVPAAYKLAQNQQEALNARFVSLKATFEENQCISNLLAFLDLVSNGTAAINMSIPEVVPFVVEV